MSRSGYIEDCEDNWASIRYRGAVKAAIRGKRGQDFLKEIVAALDALPEPKLIGDSLVTPSGDYCTLGAVGRLRGMKLDEIDPEDIETVAAKFGVAEALAREIVYENDEAGWYKDGPEARFKRMRNWAQVHIKN